MATRTSIAGTGLNWKLTTTWVGGVVPIDGDTVIIPAGSGVVQHDNDFESWATAPITIIQIAGSLGLTANNTVSCRSEAAITVQSGNSVSFNSIDTDNYGLVVIRSARTPGRFCRPAL